MGTWGQRRTVALFVLLIATLGFAATAYRAAAEQPAAAPETHPAAVHEPPPSAPGSQTATATISAIVPPETFVRLDGHGDVVEAMTNSGHAPAPSDLFFVVHDGVTHQADAATVAQVLDGRGGDWTQPGRWHALQD